MNLARLEDYIVERRAYWERQGYTEDQASEAAARDANEEWSE